MALDSLPGKIDIPTRDVLVEQYKRDYRFRAPPGTLTGDGTQPDIDARVTTDTVVPLYADARTVGQNLVMGAATLDALDTWATSKGLSRREATGAVGYVQIAASAGGTTIFEDDEIREPNSGLRFRCVATATYADGAPVPIVGLDTGPSTNLTAGTVLQWSSPRPGCAQNATVAPDDTGAGLLGGRGRENDDELRERIRDRNANPPASGNTAEYIEAAEETPVVSMQKCFAMPAIKGPGTIALVFTLRPSSPGGSRVPNNAQIALVEAYVKGRFPADDGLFMCSVVAQPVDVVLNVEWRDNVEGWADVAPWPAYFATASAIVVLSATSATLFVLGRSSGVYSGLVQPLPGQAIALYDAPFGAFRRKKILSVTGTGPWTITVDASNGASDEGYKPVVGQRAMPWSESLDTVVAPITSYFDKIGTGEQVLSFFDEGLRQKRFPLSPKEWPSTVNNRLIRDVFDVEAVQDVVLVEPDISNGPLVTNVGSQAVFSRLLQLTSISVYPL